MATVSYSVDWLGARDAKVENDSTLENDITDKFGQILLNVAICDEIRS